MTASAATGWRDLKAILRTYDQEGLIALVRDLYRADAGNRRFLHGRLALSQSVVEEYRRVIADAVYPDPFSHQPVRLRVASDAVIHYERSTGDQVGTVDLRLTFIEAGTEQAVDLGYGDDQYFGTLARQARAIAKSWPALPVKPQERMVTRLRAVRDRGKSLGWGYGDCLDEAYRAVLDSRCSSPGNKRSNKGSQRTPARGHPTGAAET